ncbi:MAG: hypothetical protein JW893_02945 [Candidatus Omnitrophica bacterium]|nr:hypothetical protein [Candidatus Omnitrophota bacterium]
MRTIIGLSILIILGYLGAYHFRTFFKKSKVLDQFLNSGFLFILIGVLCGPFGMNLLSVRVIHQLDPFIYLGLGWIGFIVGLQFEMRLLKLVPKRIFFLAQLEGLVSLAVLFGGLWLLLSGLAGVMRSPVFEVWTGVIILSACGAVSSSLAARYYAKTLPKAQKALRPLEYLISLHVFIPVLALLILYSFFHLDQREGEHFSGWVWMVTHGLVGVLLGVMMFYLLKVKMRDNERLLLILGSIIFSSGIAGYLHLSPVVICFIAGIIFANLPGFNSLLMEAVLRRAERPVYFILLILAGSLWDFRSVWVWIFLATYMLIRFVAKGVAFLSVLKLEPSLELKPSYLGGMLAQGPLAIAFVIGYEVVYSSGFLPFIVTAILGGAMLNEILAGQLMLKAFPPQETDEMKRGESAGDIL